jgi:hypothetical protein
MEMMMDGLEGQVLLKGMEIGSTQTNSNKEMHLGGENSTVPSMHSECLPYSIVTFSNKPMHLQRNP